MRSGNGPLKFKTMGSSPMKDRMEEVRHLGDPEGGAIWHEDDTPHSDRTITPEEEDAIEKRNKEERAAKIAENQKKLDASRVVIPEGVPSIAQLTKEKKKSAGSHEAFLNYERQVDKWIKEGMDPKEAIAKAQEMMNKELALETAEAAGGAASKAGSVRRGLQKWGIGND